MAPQRFPLPPIPTALPSVDVIDNDSFGSDRLGSANVSFFSKNETPEPTTLESPSALGEVHRIPNSDGAGIWHVGVGDAEPHHFRTAGAALIRAANTALNRSAAVFTDTSDVPVVPDGTLHIHIDPRWDNAKLGELLLGLLLGGYRYRVTGDADSRTVAAIRLIARSEQLATCAELARRIVTLAHATALTRDLANTPSNVKTPVWLAETVKRVLSSSENTVVSLRDEEWLARKGFGGILAVAGGSDCSPRLIEIEYRPTSKPHASTPHVLLVGKGITFDTGGLSVKPADGMHLMRTDMAGGAAVAAAMRAIAELAIPVRVTALIPAAENHISGGAYRPGDIVRHYGGKTTEVHNTDAEGRMVLADALAYGIEKFSPNVVIDVATLTGGMKVALGLRTGGFFTNRDEIAGRVAEAGKLAAESWWRLPLLGWLREHVTSGLADVCQTPKGPPGITAALFLQEFVGDTAWAHLDIAGPARADKNYADVVAGATGFSARTLVEMIASYAPSS